MDDATKKRFWSKTESGPNDCIIWTRGRQVRGYGKFYYQGKTRLAHVVSFVWANGFRPEAVMHTCDNPPCVNPDHLRAGTILENNRDMLEKGRYNMSGLSLGPQAGSRKAKAKMHCARGHEYTPETVHVRASGRRDCKLCWKLDNNRRRVEIDRRYKLPE